MAHKGDAITRVLKVVKEALAQRRKQQRHGPAPAHWLDAAVPRFGGQAVQDVKELLSVLVIFIPVPLFWTLFDQTASRYGGGRRGPLGECVSSSHAHRAEAPCGRRRPTARWTFQAISMDREVTVGGSTWTVKPDQMQMFNSVFVLLLIPTFDRVVYPLLRRVGLPMRPLQRMGAGMLLSAVAFVITGFLQLGINASTLGVIPTDPACESGACCLDNCVSVFWQVLPYFILTSGEIMLSVTGLEFGTCD